MTKIQRRRLARLRRAHERAENRYLKALAQGKKCRKRKKTKHKRTR